MHSDREEDDDVRPQRPRQQQFQKHSRREARATGRLRAVFLLLLIIGASVVGVLVYGYTRDQEELHASMRFETMGNDVLDVVDLNFQHSLQSLEMWSLQMTSLASATTQVFPYVTIPDFEAQASQTLESLPARSVGVAPIVANPLQWNLYSALYGAEWIQESLEYSGRNDSSAEFSPFIFQEPGRRATQPLHGNAFLPMWHNSPLQQDLVNYDMMNYTFASMVVDSVLEKKTPVLVHWLEDGETAEAFVAVPIFGNVKSPTTPEPSSSGILFAFVPWETYFHNIVPEGEEPIDVVVTDTCAGSVSYRLTGPNTSFLALEDVHDTDLDEFELIMELDMFEGSTNCTTYVRVYPTVEFLEASLTNNPGKFTFAAVSVFMVCTLLFIIYDWLSKRWRRKVEKAARRNSALVNSLFPEQVRDRLMLQDASDDDHSASPGVFGVPGMPKMHDLMPDLRKVTSLIPDIKHLNPMRVLEEIMSLGEREQQQLDQEHVALSRRSSFLDKSIPIADLFPSASVLFGDIAGFTAWSSQREPPQVFLLLESVYAAFDKIARRRKVFKVETIGDCYMAATGLPERRDDHAVIMAGFARECLVTMNDVVRELEVRLGPDTSELACRFGIHSGPVTAGVLRGEKSRFQLFGDTVNTASRMESTGVRDKIQMTQETADLLIQAGKRAWIEPRKEMVDCKGKGKLQTYWLSVGAAVPAMKISQPGSSIPVFVKAPRRRSMFGNDWDGFNRFVPTKADVARSINENVERMVDWNVDVLQRLLKGVVASRVHPIPHGEQVDVSAISRSGMVVDEMQDTVTMPERTSTKLPPDSNDVELPSNVFEQLRAFVTTVAFMYKGNEFHTFEHAMHVTQAASKFLAGITAPTNEQKDERKDSDSMSVFHKVTIDLTTDPFTQFALVFSALIHDAEHPGLPNAQLVAENTELAMNYQGKSVSEQNSIDIAWNLLMESTYQDLRSCIFSNQTELLRFRELVVNIVMATDIADKSLNAHRKAQWKKYFGGDTPEAVLSEVELNEKAKLVLDCLIQASDVSHTMQHWQIYIKWNQRFFNESYRAYNMGKADNNPADNWYEGELGFFDFYIIPLIGKLKRVGIFGVTTDEYMAYALANRNEWERKGKDLVRQYLEDASDREFDDEEGSIIDV